jgi:tRNA-2-methylthio-N6-dimethylallyladenosine synthase
MMNKSDTQNKVFLKTFGCQMNERDSEAVTGLLLEYGFEKASAMERADLVLVNTCSVRDHAESKVFGLFGKFKELKQKNPNLVVGIIGCMAQAHGSRFFKKCPEIDLVCGPGNLNQIPSLVEQIRKSRAPRLAVDRLGEDYALDGVRYRGDDLRALVSIMTGCDNRCTYCVVPLVRGKERSRTAETVLKEIRELESAGFKDVTLLGQNVNSYGKDLKENIDFCGLLEAIQSKAPALARLRFMTSHPKDVHPKLFGVMRDLPMVCEHLHLPVQSGSNAVLKRMKREHTVEWYIERVQEYRSIVPGGSLTTDFIVGFPGETEKDFTDTLSLLERIEFDGAYLFHYSPRPHTPAAKLKDDVPLKEKSRRLQVMLKAQRAINMKQNQSLIGKTFEVLFDSVSAKNKKQQVGRTRDYRRVAVLSESNLRGKFCQVRIVAAANETLLGEI